MPPTTKYELIQLRLGRSLAVYLTEARRQGRHWRTIAADLSAATGVQVSYETVRNWTADLDAKAAS